MAYSPRGRVREGNALERKENEKWGNEKKRRRRGNVFQLIIYLKFVMMALPRVDNLLLIASGSFPVRHFQLF